MSSPFSDKHENKYLKSYLNKFSSSKIGKNTSVNFKTYDWNLNN